MPDIMHVNGSCYRVIGLLGKGKGGYSYLVEREGQPFVLKQIHHEPCDYYTFGNKLEAEMRDYARLKAAGIRIPAMLEADEGKERILKEYIHGPTVSELVEQGCLPEDVLSQGESMARLAEKAGLNIDYYPTNFIVQEGVVWYIDYECNEYMPQWSFDQWGRKYWAPKKGENPDE